LSVQGWGCQMDQQHHDYDIAVIGSGIGGSSLGMILARHGLRVIIFEAKSHPRFAIGESMILETSETMRALAERFDVPELAYFSSENYFNFIGTSHGVKRHFSYLHHEEGKPQQIDHALQAVIPRQPHGHELHLYRQDVDSYLTTCAVRYGATVLQNTPITQIALTETGVTLTTHRGAHYSAAYVVDAGGYKSLIADQFNLRDHDLRTHSRGLFTHMVGVPDFHKVGVSRKGYGLPYSVAEGTLHHIFHGGWLWVIPFDNHRRATNPLCSVGLLLDPRIYPQRDDLTPEEEFRTFIARFPSIAAHLQNARAVREWTRAPRIQYSSTRVVGNRWALLGHAAGFIDPLFSKGLYTTMMSMGLLANLLLDARYDNDYSAERFQPLEDLTLGFIRTNDRLIASSFKSFSNYKLWRVYAVLWLLGAYTELVKLSSIRVQTHDRQSYFAQAAALRLAGGAFPAFFTLANQIDTLIEAVDPQNEEAVDATVAKIQTLFSAIDWLPLPFQEILAGKTSLPKHKVRPDLFGHHGFMREGDYRRHFFGTASMRMVVQAFLRDKLTYAEAALNARRLLTRLL
ncbi:MAG TPA: tryptophan 7-halogenase, partial [Caldilineaceae bacterium]|nr:tryptophan 7-halogenase [Caldilineaceae bacterium]